MLHDLRHALRGLLRTPAFTAISILTLALGIGANTAVLSLARAVFINPLPFRDADRLVAIAERRAGSRDTNIPVSGHEFAAWNGSNHVFERMAISRGAAFNLTGAGEPEAIQGVLVSASYLPTMGLAPTLGRPFLEGEDAAGRNGVVILSDGLWRRRFGADPNIIGRAITLDDQSFSVVGVMGPLPASLVPDLIAPLDMADHIRAVGRHNLNVVARLRPGVAVDAARSDVAAISERLAATMPRDNTGHAVAIAPLRDQLVGEFRRASWLIVAAVGFVLLIGCANVANLLLARGANRQREIAIRTALGAGRARVVRELVVESLVLAVFSGAMGLLIAAWIMDLAPTIPAISIPLLETARLGWSGISLAVGISLLTGLAAGLVPAFRSSRVHPAWLREGNRMSDDPERRRLRTVLVACEVALTLVLLVGAGLMINSFVRLISVDPGFRAAGVLVVPLDLPASRYPQAYQRRDFYDRVIDRVEHIPGVAAAGAVSHLPLGGADNWMPFRVAGRPDPAPGQEPYAPFRVATPEYFKTLQIPLRRGRFFDERDARQSMPIIRWFPQQPYPEGFDKPQAAPVAVVSEAAARQFWPGADPIGQRIRVLFSSDVTVVGVVGDIRHNGLNLPAYPHIYLPHNQEPWNSVSMVVRTDLSAELVTPAIRQQIREADPALPITVRKMDDVLSASVGQPRLYAAITGLFGIVALLLAVVGIFGVVSYVAAQRTREIGVRMALGATRRSVAQLILRQGSIVIGAGLGVGLLLAVATGRWVKSFLYQVQPLDALTYVAVVVALSTIGLIAALLPARKAASIEPMEALRED